MKLNNGEYESLIITNHKGEVIAAISDSEIACRNGYDILLTTDDEIDIRIRNDMNGQPIILKRQEFGTLS